MKFNKLKMAVMGALMVPVVPVVAEEHASEWGVSGNVGLYSDYVFRGYTQTINEPALQGGFDLEHSSGFYAGVWASNVDWTVEGGSMEENSMEIDVYAGFSGSFGDSGASWDVGILQFLYPGKDTTPSSGMEADATELYASIGYDFGAFSAALTNYHVISNDAWAFGDMDGENYTHLGIDVPVGDALTLSASVGHQTIGDSKYDYTDWKINAEYALNDTYAVGAFYTDTDQSDDWTVNGTALGDDVGGAYLSASF
jgi:uncharacterized protein (TIGR02001 family)